MPEWVYIVTIICVVLSYITMGIYYLWVFLIAFFPKVQHCKDIAYSEDMDIHFFIVVPCLNEGGVAAGTVGNIFKTNMKNLRVIVVDDDSKDDTVAKLTEAFENAILPIDNGVPFSSEFSNKKLILLKRHLPDAQLGKGKSLNCAYTLISKIIECEGIKPSKCIMGILDADSFLSRRVLERTAVIMHTDRTVGMVQARLRIGTYTRDHFLPLFQDMEFFAYINNMQNLREYTGTVCASGNGQFNRVSAIDPEQPWTDCLLEDYDFSLRLLLKGWRTRLLQEDRVFQQGVLKYRKFVRQRSRWCQGGMQCLSYWNYIKNSRYLSTYGKIESIFFMTLPFITLVSVFSQILSWFIIIYYYWTGQSIIFSYMAPYPTWELAAVFMLMSLFVFLPGIVYGVLYRKDTRESLLTCLLASIFQSIYNLMQVPAVLKAVWREMTNQKGWIKTEHYEEKKRKNHLDTEMPALSGTVYENYAAARKDVATNTAVPGKEDEDTDDK